MKEQRKREKARLEADEERLREVRRKARERQRRYRKANSEKVKEQRERNREAENEVGRERYAQQKGCPVPPPSPLPCDCGLCLACGGWTATWQPAWHARLKAWWTPRPDSAKEDHPLVELEDLPLDLLESEAETLSIASTSRDRQRVGGSFRDSARGRVGLRGGDGTCHGPDASVESYCSNAQCVVPGLGGGEPHAEDFGTKSPTAFGGGGPNRHALGVTGPTYRESGRDCGGDVCLRGSPSRAG